MVQVSVIAASFMQRCPEFLPAADPKLNLKIKHTGPCWSPAPHWLFTHFNYGDANSIWKLDAKENGAVLQVINQSKAAVHHAFLSAARWESEAEDEKREPAEGNH